MEEFKALVENIKHLAEEKWQTEQKIVEAMDQHRNVEHRMIQVFSELGQLVIDKTNRTTDNNSDMQPTNLEAPPHEVGETSEVTEPSGSASGKKDDQVGRYVIKCPASDVEFNKLRAILEVDNNATRCWTPREQRDGGSSWFFCASNKKMVKMLKTGAVKYNQTICSVGIDRFKKHMCQSVLKMGR